MDDNRSSKRKIGDLTGEHNRYGKRKIIRNFVSKQPISRNQITKKSNQNYQSSLLHGPALIKQQQ